MAEVEFGEPALAARSLAQIKKSSFAIGRHTVVALNDGEFAMPRDFLSDPGPHDDLVDRSGVVRLPIGCFLIPGETMILIDSGFGPRRSPPLRGGLLLAELATVGVQPGDIEMVAISHLHRDHRGWLGTAEGQPTFPNAQVFVGHGDWSYFSEGKAGTVEPSERAAIELLYGSGKLTLLDRQLEISSGVVAIPAPGHTPGHTVYAVIDKAERALLLGDAMYCPQQLTELDWGAIVDVDPQLARSTREVLSRDLEAHGSLAIGCHFPDLHATRLLKSS